MQEKVADTTPAAPLKLDVSVRVIEPVKNLMGFASVKFNDCFVVENLKIVQGSKGLFVGMPSQPDGKGGYRDMAYPVTKEFREQLNTAVLQAYEVKLEQMAERGSAGRASISEQLKAGKAAAEQAKAERRRNPCHVNGRAMTRLATMTASCWAAVPKRTATPIPC